jgi:surfeit locus 1 family protein
MSHPLVRPRWILVHVLVLSLAVAMVFLGFWQMDRRDQKRELNATIMERTTIAQVPLQEILTNSSEVSALEWRVVTATGTYLPNEAVTIINRSQDATAGYTPLAPLLLEDGTVVWVNRGFAPLNQPIPSLTDDTVTVLGYLRKTQTRGSLGAIDSTDPSTTEFHRIDVELISQRLSYPTLPMYVQLIEQSPAVDGQWPSPATLPDLDEGPHFSYAVQWWFFSLVACTGWVVVVRRAIRQHSTKLDAPEKTSV